MWSRKRIDIAWSDLAAGLAGVLFRFQRKKCEHAIAEAWTNDERAVISCLSVRSGWDLLLDALDLPKGSEVLMSAMTIPDMAAIVEAHGLVPVPLELDLATAAPALETLRQAFTPKSQIVLIAHLFGSRINLNPHIEMARERGLMFVEDCAQAYVGPQFAGHSLADVSLFSFGNIKTNTALGGGVLHLRDADLYRKMTDRQAQYPVQSRSGYARRILKDSSLKLLSLYPMFSMFTRTCRLMGIDPGTMLNRSVRGFTGTWGVEQFRIQPSVPLLALMARRLQRPDLEHIERQREWGERLDEQIQSATTCPGRDATNHHYWVFPILADSPHDLIAFLYEQGFDATQGESMKIVKRPEDSPAQQPVTAQEVLNRMVYVPMYPELTEKAVDRLAEVLLQYFEDHPLENFAVSQSVDSTPLQEAKEA